MGKLTYQDMVQEDREQFRGELHREVDSVEHGANDEVASVENVRGVETLRSTRREGRTGE